jgi:hypothetical protein
LFYTPLPYSAVSSSLLLDGSHLQQLQILNPSYPDPLAGLTSATSIPQNLTHLSSTLRLPYLVQYNFGVEHQLGKGLTLTTMYTGSKGVALFRSRDINAPVYAPFLNRPNSQFGIIRQVESSGGSKYQQLRTSLQASGGRYFTGMFIYELAKATDDTSGIDSFPANNWDPKGEWSFAANDTRHFVYMYGTMTAVAWLKLSIAFSANTGHPYTMTTGRDDYHVGMSTARPAGVARNTLRTTGAQTVDVRWSKSFSLRKDGPSLQVAADAFNVLNRVNYTNFVGSQSSPLFGRPSSSSPARRLQLSVYFGF